MFPFYGQPSADPSFSQVVAPRVHEGQRVTKQHAEMKTSRALYSPIASASSRNKCLGFLLENVEFWPKTVCKKDTMEAIAHSLQQEHSAIKRRNCIIYDNSFWNRKLYTGKKLPPNYFSSKLFKTKQPTNRPTNRPTSAFGSQAPGSWDIARFPGSNGSCSTRCRLLRSEDDATEAGARKPPGRLGVPSGDVDGRRLQQPPVLGRKHELRRVRNLVGEVAPRPSLVDYVGCSKVELVWGGWWIVFLW